MSGHTCEQAVILAAGLGSRLLPLTADAPKPLTSVNGTQILDNALRALRQNGIRSVTIVVGYKKEMIRAACLGASHDLSISFIESDSFSSAGSAHSLWLARDVLAAGDTLVLEGDVFFENAIISRCIHHSTASTATVASFSEAIIGSAVRIGDDGSVVEVRTKQNAETARAQNLYKTINIMVLRRRDSEKIIIPELTRMMVRDKTGFLEQCLSRCIRGRSLHLSACVCNDLKWFEIDDLNDLRAAEAMFSVEVPVE
ncbi:phosphocholine cytidylyltransferase family protein (plasmid) [Nitrobacteraceae bacterium UC4449_H16]